MNGVKAATLVVDGHEEIIAMPVAACAVVSDCRLPNRREAVEWSRAMIEPAFIDRKYPGALLHPLHVSQRKVAPLCFVVLMLARPRPFLDALERIVQRLDDRVNKLPRNMYACGVDKVFHNAAARPTRLLLQECSN